MPKAKTTTAMAQEHEEFVAILYGGTRERASGANPARPGDVPVRVHGLLIECKATEKNSQSISRKRWDKAKREAYERGLRPAIAIRLRDPYEPRNNIDLITVDVHDYAELLEKVARYEDLCS